MTNIRGTVIGFANMKDGEDVFISRALATLLTRLKKIPKASDYEYRYNVSTMLREFSVAMMAALAVIRSGQPLEEISRMEESLKKAKNGAQIQFIGRILSALCAKGDATAIEIAVFFFNDNHCEIDSASKNMLEKTGQSVSSRNAIVSVLQKWVLRKSGTLNLIAKLDVQAAMDQAVSLLTNRDPDVRHEALAVVSDGTLTKETSEKIAQILKKETSVELWENVESRADCCRFIQKAFESGFLAKENAIELLKKAFCHEYCNRGLASLLPALKAVDPKNRQLLIGGFIAMEEQHGDQFSVRSESVKKFLGELTPGERIAYLKQTLTASFDSRFCWMAGQYLIAADPAVAADIFVQCAKEKATPKSLDRIETLTQLAVRICDPRNETWIVPELNKGVRTRYVAIAKALLAFAESEDCTRETRLAIAYQAGMYGRDNDNKLAAIALLGKILVEDPASPEDFRKALQALLNTSAKNGLLQETSSALKNTYSSKNGKLLLEQMLFILSHDIRGDICEPLYPAIVSFLVDINASAAIPVLKKALNAKLPDGDLGMCARRTYIKALENFALRGSRQAVTVISEYRGSNTWYEAAPQTLVNIYQNAPSEEIKSLAALGVANRFLQSIKPPQGCDISYFKEFEAVKSLRDNAFVQKAYLEGLASIAEIGNRRSNGMCNLVENISSILPKEQLEDGRKTLVRLIDDLASDKEAFIADCRKKQVPVRESEYIKTIDLISAEAGLALAVM